MKIDGVDFSSSNSHTLRLWDSYNSIGPYFIIIDDEIRVGKSFTIFIQEDTPEIYQFIEKQSEIDYQCTMSISVLQPKTKKLMYVIILKTELLGIKFGEDMDSSDIFLTYKCLEARDETKYK